MCTPTMSFRRLCDSEFCMCYEMAGDAEVPDYIASYAIHLSAVNIIVAIEASKE
jgi:hypothetical protein